MSNFSDGVEGVEHGAEGRLLDDAAPAVAVFRDAPQQDPYGSQLLVHHVGLQARYHAPHEPLGEQGGPRQLRGGGGVIVAAFHDEDQLGEEDERRGLGLDAHLHDKRGRRGVLVSVAAAADGGDEGVGHVHLDELLRRGRQEVEEGHGLGQALLEQRDEAVDPGERLRDGELILNAGAAGLSIVVVAVSAAGDARSGGDG
jgi:hypothetical protein